MGMAKEISAVLDVPSKIFVEDGVLTKEFSKDFKTSDFLSLEVEDENLVKRATKRMARNVKIQESPE
jgi:hypothetical protein